MFHFNWLRYYQYRSAISRRTLLGASSQIHRIFDMLAGRRSPPPMKVTLRSSSLLFFLLNLLLGLPVQRRH